MLRVVAEPAPGITTRLVHLPGIIETEAEHAVWRAGNSANSLEEGAHLSLGEDQDQG